MIKVRPIYVTVPLIYLASYLIGSLLGVRFVFEVIPALWQYVDVEILHNDLAKGIYYLHSQPPLFNLFIGIVLKVSSEFYPLLFWIIFQAIALGTLFLMANLMESFRISRWIILLVVALYALSPTFVVYSNYVFYTLPVAFLLLLSARLLLEYLSRGQTIWLHLCCWSLVVIMLTRATYHYFWYALVIATIALIRKRDRRRILQSSILPLLVVLLWSAKNYSLVNNFGLSSWLGMNFARGWIVTNEKLYERGAFFNPQEAENLLRSGVVKAPWLIGPFQQPDAYRKIGYFHDTKEMHPAITSELKRNGLPNFNHSEYARISKDMLLSTIRVIREFPAHYLKRISTAYMAFMQPGPGVSWTFTRFYDFRKVLKYRDSLSHLFLARPEYYPSGVIPFNLLMIGFPILIFYGLCQSVKQTRSELEKAFFAYVSITLISVTITCIAIELGENDRIRAETDPLTVILLGFLISSFRSDWKSSSL
ncbi:glycosyltransferase family 39 protein [bacterium]|nr:glycosyltransferase family 39 protein [bacterium]